MLEVIVACFVLLFFYAFVQYSTWPKGCLRAGRSREWLLASRFGRFLYPLGAHLLQAAFENSKLFLWIAVSSLLRASRPPGPELF
jgi:hypothetical protein